MNKLSNGLRICVKPAATVALLAAALSGLTGCASYLRQRADKKIAAGPNVIWTPPAQAVAPVDTTSKTAKIPEKLIALKDSLTLEDIVDLALRNNPRTKAAWAGARSAAANLGSKKGELWPQIEATAEFRNIQGSAIGGRFNYNQRSYQPSISLNYILFDFGKRRADVEEARQALYYSNYTHNATIQDVVLLVEQAYYQYLYAKALRQAEEATFKEARSGLDAAEQRHQAGLATITDVLQARTKLSQSQLALQTVEGQIQTIRGSLATAMGLPANLDYDVGFLPNQLPVSQVDEAVEQLIKEAELKRPDLAAARAQALEAEARINSVRAEGLPSLYLNANRGLIFYNKLSGSGQKTSSLGIGMQLPLFTGFSSKYDVLKAEADAEDARQRLGVLERTVVLDVWSSYYGLKTSAQRLKTSETLLESAGESHTVALERYKAGVGSILELLSVQASLENARAQNLQARTDWFLSLAQLAHDTGTLWLSEATTPEQGLKDQKKDEKK